MEPFASKLAEWIARERLDQSEAGRRIGVSDATVSRWINGRRIPGVPEAIRVARATGLSLDVLFGLADESAERNYVERKIRELGVNEVMRRVAEPEREARIPTGGDGAEHARDAQAAKKGA